MSLEKLIGPLIEFCIDVPIIREIEKLTGPILEDVIVVLKQHFLLSSYEIGKAFQDSFGDAMDSIGTSLISDENWIEYLKKRLKSRISREFIEQVKIYLSVNFSVMETS